MNNRKNFLITEIVKYSQKIDAKGFAANHDGNISVKFDDTLLATPTAISKGNIIEEMIITLDQSGKKLAGIGKPFSEIKLHLAAYHARPEINAVVHAHPPFATARGLINQPIIPNLPEAIVSIGDIVPIVPLTMPGSDESIQTLSDALTQVDVCMIAGNGVLAVGENIEQAYLRLELVEHLAKIQFYTQQTGTPLTLPAEMIDALLEKRKAAGLGPKQAIAPKSSSPSNEQLSLLIADEIKKILGDHENH